VLDVVWQDRAFAGSPPAQDDTALTDVLHGAVFESMILTFKCVLGLALTCISKKVYKIIERNWKLFKITILSTERDH
jgi:hypothetical protein